MIVCTQECCPPPPYRHFSSGATIADFAYTHDAVGNRLSKTQTASPHGDDGKGVVKYSYAFDKVYRLLNSLPTKLNNGKDKEQEHKAETFVYDAVGNRLTGPRARTSYTYGAGNELISSLRSDDEDDAISYEYDNNGNLIRKTETDGKSWTYGYDFENRLTKAVKRKGHETKTITFKYDPFGRRMEKKVEKTEDGRTETKTHTYVYDNEDVIIEYLTKTEDNETKTEVVRYVHGHGIDEPLSMEQSPLFGKEGPGEIFYYHADGLGSITALTDSKQKVVESYSYDSFGELKRKGDKIKNTYTFTGREWDKEVKLYYYRARYYDAKVGRFTQKDPIGFMGGDVNLYSYVGQNPVRYIDPLGMAGFDTVVRIVTGIAVRPLVGHYITDPAGQRIIAAGIAGAVGGAVAGAVVGVELGKGHPVAIIGGAVAFSGIGLATGMKYQIALEATGIQAAKDSLS